MEDSWRTEKNSVTSELTISMPKDMYPALRNSRRAPGNTHLRENSQAQANTLPQGRSAGVTDNVSHFRYPVMTYHFLRLCLPFSSPALYICPISLSFHSTFCLLFNSTFPVNALGVVSSASRTPPSPRLVLCQTG